MAIVYPHYGHREALKALKKKQRASLVAASQIQQLNSQMNNYLNSVLGMAEMKKAYFDQLVDHHMMNFEPETPRYIRLHTIGRVSLWRVENVHFPKFVAKLSIPGEEIKESFHVTPRMALKGLRKFLRKTYKKQGEIIAHRCWKVENGYLKPLTDSGRGVTFTGPILEAHELPTMENNSGLYSVKKDDSDWVRQQYDCHAYGEVGCYGRVIEHEGGYRSQYQVIRKITLVGDYPEWFVKGMSDMYQCEVTVAKPDHESKLMRMMTGFGTPWPKAFTTKLTTTPPPLPPPPLSPLAQQIMQPGSVLNTNQNMYNQLRKMGLVP